MSFASSRRGRTVRWAAPALASVLAVTTVSTQGAEAAPDHPRPTPQPDVVALAGPLAAQELDWQKCSFGAPEYDDLPNLACADVTVPRDWDDPANGKTWTLRISQLTNLERTDRRYRGTIFGNPGGPGVSGLDMSLILKERAPRLAESFNLVGFEPRGTGAGSLAVCRFNIDFGATDPAVNAKYLADGCSENPDVRTINSRQTAYDMDFMRFLMGLRKLDYIGYSYGTWLGSTYERIFPRNTGKVLLDSSTDVTAPSLQNTFQKQPIGRDRQFQYRLTGYLARNNATYGLGTDRADIYRRYIAARNVITPAAFTLAWTKGKAIDAFAKNRFYPDQAAAATAVIKAVESGALRATGETASSPAVAAAVVLRQMASLPATARTTTSESLLASARTLDRVASLPDPVGPVFEVDGTQPFDFIRCNDGQWTQGLDYWQGDVDRARTRTPVSWDLGTVVVPACAWWRASSTALPVPRKDFPQTLVLQSELDSQTYYEGAFNTGTKMPNTKAIFIDNEGSHGLFPYGTACADEPIYAFFERGALPKRDVTICQAKPIVGESTTYETWTRLDRQGRPTRPVDSAFVPAPTPRPSGPKGYGPGALGDPGVEMQVRSQLAREMLARYGRQGVRLLDLDDALIGPAGG